jgi:hypothetical protein
MKNITHALRYCVRSVSDSGNNHDPAEADHPDISILTG